MEPKACVAPSPDLDRARDRDRGHSAVRIRIWVRARIALCSRAPAPRRSAPQQRSTRRIRRNTGAVIMKEADDVVLLVLGLIALTGLLLAFDYARDRGWLSSVRHRIAGELVVITGAAGGLGRELAVEFSRRGAVLALWDVRATALEDLAACLIREHNVPIGSIHTRVVDVADSDAVAAAATEQRSALGPARVVVSNAAVVYGQSVMEARPAAVTAAFGVNVLGHFWCARAFLPQMLQAGAQPGGVFVTTGSLMAELPAARLADYCASKAALKQLHECLRWELHCLGERARHVRVCHVQPYLIETPLFEGGTPLKYAWMRPLVPPLRASTVAQRTACAVECGRERLVLPWVFKWLPPLLQCMPAGLRDAALVLAGASGAMEGFTGRNTFAR